MKYANLTRKAAIIVLIAACSFLFANVSTVFASEIPEPGDIEIEREAAMLFDEIRADPVDPSFIETALVFTNARRLPAKLRCAAFNQQGDGVGRVWVKLPPKGLRYVLASDFSDGKPFIGSARCIARGDVIGSAMLLGPNLTDVKVRQRFDRNNGITHITFPLIAVY